MSTRCFIGIKSETGTIGIYCHHDGYPGYTGALLLNYYNTEERARALVDMGGASHIGQDLSEQESCFYHRDRGEPLEKCDVSSMATFDYGYIFTAGKGWEWYKCGKKQDRLTMRACQ